MLAGDLGGGDPFCESVAGAIVGMLEAPGERQFDELVAAALAMARVEGWRDPGGALPGERDVGWVVGDVLARGEAYGLLRWAIDLGGQRRRGPFGVALTPAGRAALLPEAAPARVAGVAESTGREMLVFDAVLQSGLAETVRGVGARLGVRAEQPLSALHDAIQEAFGWWDDHLYLEED